MSPSRKGEADNAIERDCNITRPAVSPERLSDECKDRNSDESSGWEPIGGHPTLKIVHKEKVVIDEEKMR